jgi:hypothetical protein
MALYPKKLFTILTDSILPSRLSKPGRYMFYKRKLKLIGDDHRGPYDHHGHDDYRGRDVRHGQGVQQLLPPFHDGDRQNL